MARSDFNSFDPIRESGKIVGYRVWVSRGVKSDGTRNRRSKVSRGSLAKAKIVAAELYADMADKTAKRPDITLREFIEGEWLPHQAKDPKIAENTYAGYASKMSVHVLPAHGDRRLSTIGPQDIDSFVADMYAKPSGLRGPNGEARTMSDSSVNHVYRVYSNAMKQAKRWKYITVSPFDDTDTPPVGEHAFPDAITIIEAKRYFDAFRGHRIEPVILMSLGAGLRPSESMGVDWEDIDFERGVYALVRTWHQKGARTWEGPLKTRASRQVTPITPWVLQRLTELRVIGPLVTGDDGERMKPDRVTAHYNHVIREFGLRRITLKNCRHSFANMLKAQGVSPYVISMLMRHSTIKTTEDYYFDADIAPLSAGTDAFDRALKTP